MCAARSRKTVDVAVSFLWKVAGRARGGAQHERRRDAPHASRQAEAPRGIDPDAARTLRRVCSTGCARPSASAIALPVPVAPSGVGPKRCLTSGECGAEVTAETEDPPCSEQVLVQSRAAPGRQRCNASQRRLSELEQQRHDNPEGHSNHNAARNEPEIARRIEEAILMPAQPR